MAERRLFSREEKVKIIAKTSNRCTHCGKPLTLETMTVEHTIPISKGGSNSLTGLVALCKDCNEEKGSIIVDPVLYYPYVKSEYVKGLSDSFDAYIGNMERMSRRSVLSVDLFRCDKSKLDQWVDRNKETFKGLDSAYGDKGFSTATTMNMIYKLADGMTIKRATYSDLDELYQFYLKQARKTSGFAPELKRVLKEFMTYVFTNSCFYFVRSKAGDIVASFSVSVASDIQGTHSLWLNHIEVKYARHVGIIYDIIVDEFMDRFQKICGFDAVPIVFSCRQGDKSSQELLGLLSGFKKECEMDLGRGIYAVNSVCINENVPTYKREAVADACYKPESDCQVWLKTLSKKFK